MSNSRCQMMLSCLVITLGLLAFTSQAQLHSSAASAGVSFAPQNGRESMPPRKVHNHRMYGMCPPQFQRVGADCYSLVQQPSNWLEAHFFCRDKNANLAEPSRKADRKLRTYLQRQDAQSGEHEPIWIGAEYDHHNKYWQWSFSGRNLTYDAFSQKDPTKPLDNKCGVYDPNLKYHWSARPCPDKLRFICEHKMPKVSEANRYKIYNRWNATYPNELANEVVLRVVGERSRDGRYHRVLVAEDSADQMTIPARKRAGTRRIPPRHPVKHPNDVNYPHRPKNRPHKRPDVSSTAPPAPQIYINGVPSTVGTQPRIPATRPHLTAYDRKLQRQRERELRRQLRRQERMEKQRKMHEKRPLSKPVEEKYREQLQQHQQQSEPDALRQRTMEEQQRQEREQHEQELQVEKQRLKQKQEQEREQENHQRQQEQKREQERLKQKKVEDDEANQIREKRLRNQREREAEERKAREEELRKKKAEQDEIDRRNAEQRLANEQRLREEHEKRLLETKSEQERQLQEAREAKRREEKAVEEALAEKERQRQEQIHRAQKEEDERQELERIEKVRLFEQREIQRLREEEARREEQKRQRQAEIEQLEAEKRRLAEEEERIRQEMLEAETARKREHEHKIELEREREQREEAEKQAAEAAKAPVSKNLQKAIDDANDIVAQQLEEKRRQYAERIAALTPDDQKKFIEMRKKRKQMREKQLKAREQTKMKRIQEAIRLYDMQ